MKKNFLPFLLSAILLFSITASANVRLPAIYGSHMVLQQNSTISFWGWSDPHEKVSIKTDWDTTNYSTFASGSAKWNLNITTPASGGRHTITISGKNTVVLEDVLFGEVWVCSGQSNMEMSINWGMNQYDADVEKAGNDSIRLFQVQKTTAAYPQDDLPGKWVVSTPDAMKNFSAAGYFFGQRLVNELKIPVGLINSSWGGTPAEVWAPANIVESDPVL